jgi:predicted nucleotidyltransferase component of viral defense system
MIPPRRRDKAPTNLGASVRARLLNIARKEGIDYNRILIRYAQERLLYRISISPYCDNFILKGALLFLSYGMSDLRPTKDMDFLGRGVQSDVEAIRSIMEEIAAEIVDDGVVFDSSKIAVEQIAEQAEYGGLRASLACSVGGARNILHVDVGFGDRITAGPIEVDFPVMLDFPVPRVKVYSLESAIAEKFEAIVRLNVVTSRMKDFYDLVHLAGHHPFQARVLAEAIRVTFSTRGTPLADRKLILTNTYRNDHSREAQWMAFHATNKLPPVRSFGEALALIERFLEPILVFDPTPDLRWMPDQLRWQKYNGGSG